MKKRGIDTKMWRLIEELKAEIDSVPEPNEGRIEELKEQIREDTLITPHAIDVSAQRIMERFFGKD